MVEIVGDAWRFTPVQRVFDLVPAYAERSDDRLLSELSELELVMFLQLVELRELDLRYAGLDGALNEPERDAILALQLDLDSAYVAISLSREAHFKRDEAMPDDDHRIDLNLASDWYRETLFGYGSGGDLPAYGAPLLGEDVVLYGSGTPGVSFLRNERLDHPQHGEVVFLAAHEDHAWIESKDGFKTVELESLRRRKDIPTEEKIISLEARRHTKPRE